MAFQAQKVSGAPNIEPGHSGHSDDVHNETSM